MGSFRDILLEKISSRELREGVRKRLASEEKPPPIRRFHLNRVEDESGISGTGIVAVGVIWPDGQATLKWVSKRTKATSLGIYADIDDLEEVHGHDGKTKIVYDEE